MEISIVVVRREYTRMRLVLAFVLASCTLAVAEERPLVPVVVAPTAEKICQPFFTSTTFSGVTAPQISFSYRASNGSVVRDSLPKERVKVFIVEENKPTYEKVLVNDQNGAILRFNQETFKKAAACLPLPTTPEPAKDPAK